MSSITIAFVRTIFWIRDCNWIAESKSNERPMWIGRMINFALQTGRRASHRGSNWTAVVINKHKMMCFAVSIVMRMSFSTMLSYRSPVLRKQKTADLECRRHFCYNNSFVGNFICLMNHFCSSACTQVSRNPRRTKSYCYFEASTPRKKRNKILHKTDNFFAQFFFTPLLG